MGSTFYFDFEVNLMVWLQNLMGDMGVTIASFFTMLGEETVLVGILAFLYLCYDKKMGEFIGVNILCGIVWNSIIKNLVVRKRPYMDHMEVKCLRPVEPEADIYDIAAQGYSFPSGHSTNSAIVYGSLPVYKRQQKGAGQKAFLIISITIPALVGLSRVLLGVHYPTDVLAGWILGGLIVIFISKIQRQVKNKHRFHLMLVLFSIPWAPYCRTDDYYTSLGLMIGFFLAEVFDEKFVRFQETRNPIKIILRMTGAFAIYLSLNMILKAPFPVALLESGTPIAFGIRTMRYMIVIFTVMGIYPMIFDRIKIGRKGTSEEKE